MLKSLWEACPEWNHPDDQPFGPKEPRKTCVVFHPKVSHHDEIRALSTTIKSTTYDHLGDVPVEELLNEPVPTIWEHDGKCACGKRTYMFSTCFKCLMEELAEDRTKREKALAELDDHVDYLEAVEAVNAENAGAARWTQPGAVSGPGCSRCAAR